MGGDEYCEGGVERAEECVSGCVRQVGGLAGDVCVAM